MELFDKIYLALFTKPAGTLISKGGHFSLEVPAGFRYKKTSNVYQIFNPSDKSVLFQLTFFVLPDIEQNRFNIDQELKEALAINTNAVIQTIERYQCIGMATVTKDEKLRTYVWRIGDKNKRVLVTFLILDTKQTEVSKKLLLAQDLLSRLTIHHN